MSIEIVDVLFPPTFELSGVTKTVNEALDSGDWLGVMNLWLVRPTGTVLYQQRPPGGWEPGKLDGSVGGFYRAGESGLDGLREAEEELGWVPPRDAISLLGHHLSVSVDSQGRKRNLAVTVYMAMCAVPLHDFELDAREVPALLEVAATDVVAAFDRPGLAVTAEGLDCHGRRVHRVVRANDFSFVFGGYHRKIACIAQRHSEGLPAVYY